MTRVNIGILVYQLLVHKLLKGVEKEWYEVTDVEEFCWKGVADQRD